MIALETRNYNLEPQSGFIALMSAIIISVILLLIVTNLSLNGFYSRSNILDSELKERSSALAEACADTAILKLANNPGYTGGESMNVDGVVGDDCTIVSVLGSSIIKVQSNYNNTYFTNLKVVINSTDMSVNSWEECAVLSAC